MAFVTQTLQACIHRNPTEDSKSTAENRTVFFLIKTSQFFSIFQIYRNRGEGGARIQAR